MNIIKLRRFKEYYVYKEGVVHVHDKDFELFGYETNEPCDVCGKIGSNRVEPRFFYTVCSEHYKMSPVEASKLKAKNEA